MDILDFITEAADAPAVSSLVDGIHNISIQGLPLLEEESCKTSINLNTLMSLS